jgi:hypothetical protein
MTRVLVKYQRACGAYGKGETAAVSEARARVLIAEGFAVAVKGEPVDDNKDKKDAGTQKDPTGPQNRQTTVGPQRR